MKSGDGLDGYLGNMAVGMRGNGKHGRYTALSCLGILCFVFGIVSCSPRRVACLRSFFVMSLRVMHWSPRP